MKKRLSRALSALLIACLCLGLFPSALAEGNPLPVDTSKYPTKIDVSMTCNSAFERANERYLAGEYLEAESYYLFALKRINNSKRYTKGDVCNNLVLTFLQLEQNDEAYTLCRYMLEEGLAQTEKDKYGYMLNMLVCAHAKGITAAEELKYALDHSLFSFDDLVSLADGKPGEYKKLLVAMIYNVVYMDMEAGVADGGASYAYYPEDLFVGVENAELMEELAMLLGDSTEELSEADRDIAEDMLSKKDYLQFLLDILDEANEINDGTYDTYDPDITELTKYLSALMEQI